MCDVTTCVRKNWLLITDTDSQSYGLRLDGIPALDLWNLIVLVFENTTQNHDRTETPVVCRDKNHAKGQQSRGMFNVLNNVDSVHPNVQLSHQEALLYVFEDNEAVIKMIIKGRSPTMRHVFWTHRVVLDCLFDRINLEPKIQIKYVDTKNQLADMLTKGNLTRDEWNHLLRLLNIMSFSMSSQFVSTRKPNTMSKRAQERRTEEEPVVSTSRPACLVWRNLSARQTPSMDSGASYGPGNQESGRHSVFASIGKPVRDRVRNPAMNSQERQRDGNPFSSTGKPVRSGVCERSSTRKPVRGIENQLARMKLDNHNMLISDNQYLEKDFTNFRQKLNLWENEPILDQKTNVLIWGFFCQQRWQHQFILGHITMRTWLRTGTPTSKSSRRRSTSRRGWSWTMGSRFWMFPRLNGQCFSMDEIRFTAWQSNQVAESRSTRLVRFSVGSGIRTSGSKCKVARSTWRRPTVQGIQRIIWNRWRTHWVRVESFPGFTTLQILHKIQDKLNVCQTGPGDLKIESSSCPCSMILIGQGKFYRMCFEFRNGQELRWKVSAWTFGHSSVQEKKKMVWYVYLQTWRTVEYDCWCHGGKFQRKWTSNVNRGFLKRKGGRCTTHFTAESPNAELLFHTLHSANQLSTYGAVANRGGDLAQLILGQTHVFMEKSVAKANDQLSQQLEAQEVWSLVQDVKEEWSSSGRPPTYSWKEIWRIVERRETACENVLNSMMRSSVHESLWICRIHEESLHWNALRTYSRCQWWFWRVDTIMQRIDITSWRSRFRNHCMDRWTYQICPASQNLVKKKQKKKFLGFLGC